MTDESIGRLLSAMGVAVFERQPDGTFRSVTPPPVWFERLAADMTFPFLGHILEEASDFWRSGRHGHEDFGPCVETDERGHEFHYRIAAVSVGGRQYLWFTLDAASDRMRAVLQRARESALKAEALLKHAGEPGAQAAALEAAGQIKSMVQQLGPLEMPAVQRAIVQALLEVSERLVYSLERMQPR